MVICDESSKGLTGLQWHRKFGTTKGLIDMILLPLSVCGESREALPPMEFLGCCGNKKT
jgi:hypothetical protein